MTDLQAPLSLADVFARAVADGFTHAADYYSYHGRPIRNWTTRDIAADRNEYDYDPTGVAKQRGRYPSNHYRFWKET